MTGSNTGRQLELGNTSLNSPFIYVKYHRDLLDQQAIAVFPGRMVVYYYPATFPDQLFLTPFEVITTPP